MRKVLLYSLLLTVGLVLSQLLGDRGHTLINLLTMFCLSFIMIRVGYGFEITREKQRKHVWDFVVATATTVLPWGFTTAYFVFVMAPAELWRSRELWWEAVLQGRFAAPTSVGLLFSMLAAAGLSATWLYKKARILAIFDDLDTLLLFIPFKALLVSMNVNLTLLMFAILGLLWTVWKFVRAVDLPMGWPWVMLYSAIAVAVSEGSHLVSKVIDEAAPIQLEVLLLAFLIGCVLARSPRCDVEMGDISAGGEAGSRSPDQLATLIMAACFMLLAGLSMPSVTGLPVTYDDPSLAMRYEGIPKEVLARKNQFPGWNIIAIHVLIVSALSNIGKMVPAFCYRKEAGWKERLALGIGMFPRGEVGAGMLVVSVSYGAAGPALTVAALSLALNLVCSGLFILVIKKLVPSKA